MMMPIFLRAALALVPLGFLAACLPVPEPARLSAPLPPGVPCASGGDGACFFRNAPVRLSAERLRLPSRLLPYSTTVEELNFVDGARRHWDAPRGTLTDGASIPILFQPFLGNPRDPLFINAGVLHDAYCGVGNEGGPRWHGDRWQNVHVMFYDALVVSGAPDPKAKLMFAAVWLGGPRWDDPDRSLTGVPDAALVAAFQSVSATIMADSPSLPALIRLLEEIEVTRLAPLSDRAGNVAGGADAASSVFDPAPPSDPAPPLDAAPPSDPVITDPIGGGKPIGGTGGQGAVRPGG